MRGIVALVLVAAATGAAAAGCGGKTAGGAKDSGVYGTVKRGPLRPVCTRGASCYGPAAHLNLTFLMGGKASAKVVAHAQTGAHGGYRIALAPGTYVVQAKLGPGGVRPTIVRVSEGRFVRLDLVADTGIR
jgi:hypothetical protein